MLLPRLLCCSSLRTSNRALLIRSIVTLLCVSVLAGSLFAMQPPDVGPPDDKGKPARISWSEPRVTEDLLDAAGVVVVTFSSTQDIPDGVSIRPTFSLTRYLTVEPASYPAISADTDYDVTITVAEEPAMVAGGTVQIRQGSKTLANPLNVRIKAEGEAEVEAEEGEVEQSELAEEDEENTILWDPEVVDAALFAGGETTTINFSVTREIEGDVCVWLTPSLDGFLTSTVALFPGPLTPTDGGDPPTDVVYSFDLTLDPPLAELSGNLGGTVHLRDCADGELRRTYDEPLSVEIIVDTEEADPEAVPEAVVGAADFQQNGVAPAQLITLFGEGIGPNDLQVFNTVGSAVSSYLGDTQVLFDGVPAPLLAVVFGQINAIVPNSVAGKKLVEMQVLYRGKTSESILVPAQAALPSLFTLDSSGKGQGAILNGNGTLNSQTNPARRGTIVTLFGTGGGLTITPPVDGSVVAGKGLALAGDVAVEIGGVPADILWAGSPPGVVYGVLQIQSTLAVWRAATRAGVGSHLRGRKQERRCCHSCHPIEGLL